MIFQPPFPPVIVEPTEVESVAVFVHVAILFFLIMLMLYSHKKLSNLPVIAVYAFSLIIGLESFAHPHAPFSPMLEIFFLIFQTTIFISEALEFNKKRKR